MTLPRRDFFKLAAGACALPALSPGSALAQLAPHPAAVDEPTAPERAAMARLARAFMTKYDVPALSFAVGYAGTIVHKDAFGLADRESNEAATPAHRFRIASVTKMITSAAIFSLIEQGHARLPDKVFGPTALLGTDYGQPPFSAGIDAITLEHLLTHTAGGWTNDNRDPMFTHPKMNHAELIAWTLANRPLDRPPGRHYAYSNFGYCVLGRVIEKLTGQPYAEYVRAEVLGRCGVTDMSIGRNLLERRQPHEVKYYGQGGGDPYGMNVRRMDSHGGWIARPADIVQFLMHVDGYAKPPNILKPRTIQTMTTASAANPGYAKGFCINKYDNWWHTGALPGTTTIAVRTHGGFCWAAFTNTRRENSKIDDDLDQLNWNMVGEVKSWHVA
ncbi:MAG TPA: serine hydrolase domain-containing protein [Bradyrhizobium sp.]|uniref:serine hydrolase domain-containing protein n=1 Tax=Bradyrhizobium sp. TaxID=376 RepID=UPI002BA220B8|nr:serine hydrolase domain-containing protein [Bradyrhizobium sp.]HLZ03464.1 serine hydrolase domain-containing protein [Bradyrhizobium sp.]